MEFIIALFIVICAIVFLAIILSGCSSDPRRARAQKINELPREVVMLRYNNDRQHEIILAYNRLLHQIWLDKPTYVEECLSESDEFATLDEMFDSDWGDTFEFHSEEDSIAYSHNWDKTEGFIRVVKHVVIPEPTRSRLKSVFGKEDEK